MILIKTNHPCLRVGCHIPRLVGSMMSSIASRSCSSPENKKKYQAMRCPHPVKNHEKPSGQYLGFICDESLTRRGLNSNLGHFRGYAILPLFVWRIVFTCLMVCR
jgi:hypothetical protein